MHKGERALEALRRCDYRCGLYYYAWRVCQLPVERQWYSVQLPYVPHPRSCGTRTDDLDSAFVADGRADVDLTSAGFAPGTLASGPFMSLPVLGGYLGEVEALGNPGISDRVSTYSRLTDPELLKLYRETSAQLETLHNSFNHLLQEIHALGQQKSELYLLLALHRTFERGRVMEDRTGVPPSDAVDTPDSAMSAG